VQVEKKLDVVPLPEVQVEPQFPELEEKAAALFDQLVKPKNPWVYDPLSINEDFIGWITEGNGLHVEESPDIELEVEVIAPKDQVDVNRLLDIIKQNLKTVLMTHMFEENDTLTRGQIEASVEFFLSGLMTKSSIDDFVVICDETNNPPSEIDQGNLNIDVVLWPRGNDEGMHLTAMQSGRAVDDLTSESLERKFQSWPDPHE